jgi:hypothetical protein
LTTITVLPISLPVRHGRDDRVVVGLARGDHLQQRHLVHGGEEVHPSTRFGRAAASAMRLIGIVLVLDA